MKNNTPSRRQLLIGMGAASGSFLLPEAVISGRSFAAQSNLVHTDIDVLIIGGGTAGTIAAIQAARSGARTAVLEKGSQLGGTMTTANVNFPGLFHAWGRQVIGGIGWELVTKSVKLNGDTLPDFSVPYGNQHWRHQIRINAPLYAALAEETCLRAGIELLYYELPVSVEASKNGWIIETAGKGIRRNITCRQLIDCTGGADIVGMLGLPRLREVETQPGTLRFLFGGYDFNTLNRELIEKRYKEALATGELMAGDYQNPEGGFIHFLEGGGENAQHVMDADSSTSITQSQTNIAGRTSALRLLRFIRSLPGCENARIERMAPETGVRETYRIKGELEITDEDYVTGRIFEDAVCYSFYPIDLHDEKGILPRQLKRGIVPTIPLRALIPRGGRNLLVAGRSISSNRLANSALRVQASCMAMGQAAGAAAALASESDISPAEVPIDRLRNLLKKHGAILPS